MIDDAKTIETPCIETDLFDWDAPTVVLPATRRRVAAARPVAPSEDLTAWDGPTVVDPV